MSGSGMAAQNQQDARAGGRGSGPVGDDRSNVTILPQLPKPAVNKSVPGGDEKMTDHPTREEMNAKLEATESRMVNKLDAIVRSIDSVKDELKSQGTLAGLRFDRMDEKVNDAKAAANEARSASASVKWNILFTGLTVAALCYGAFVMWSDAVGMVHGILRP